MNFKSWLSTGGWRMAGRLSSKFNFWKSFFRREYVISSDLDCYRTTAGQSKHVRINLKYAHSWSLKMDQPRSLFLLFLVFLYKNFKFLHQIYVKKCPSSIRCWDSNPRPSEHESPSITTRPGLPPLSLLRLFAYLLRCCYFNLGFELNLLINFLVKYKLKSAQWSML